MLDFVAHKYDVLLATTIVENGLDIPNANTIIINRADRYGLSQLYQLRGRVGRSDRPAYAYLLIPPEDNAVAGREEAARGDQGIQRPGQRLPRRRARPRDPRRRQPARRRAERPHRDGRLRDVHEAARGDRPRAEGRGDRRRHPGDGQPPRRPADRRGLHPRHEPAADASIAASRPRAREDELERAVEEVRDRYGPPPDSILNLADYGRIRVMADQLGLETIDREGRRVVLKFRPEDQARPGAAGDVRAAAAET